MVSPLPLRSRVSLSSLFFLLHIARQSRIDFWFVEISFERHSIGKGIYNNTTTTKMLWRKHWGRKGQFGWWSFISHKSVSPFPKNFLFSFLCFVFVEHQDPYGISIPFTLSTEFHQDINKYQVSAPIPPCYFSVREFFYFFIFFFWWKGWLRVVFTYRITGVLECEIIWNMRILRERNMDADKYW